MARRIAVPILADSATCAKTCQETVQSEHVQVHGDHALLCKGAPRSWPVRRHDGVRDALFALGKAVGLGPLIQKEQRTLGSNCKPADIYCDFAPSGQTDYTCTAYDITVTATHHDNTTNQCATAAGFQALRAYKKKLSDYKNKKNTNTGESLHSSVPQQRFIPLAWESSGLAHGKCHEFINDLLLLCKTKVDASLLKQSVYCQIATQIQRQGAVALLESYGDQLAVRSFLRGNGPVRYFHSHRSRQSHSDGSD